jgi:N-acetylglucosaminyl-diphospho-decaprenol L-rhamnosyltransferase
MARRLSVVVVTHNSRAAVTAALPALIAQLAAGDELVVVDNASTDGTIDAVREIAPGAVIVETGSNAGFAAAANVGARAAGGDLLLFLNPDATPAPGFVPAIRDSAFDAWMGLVMAGSAVNSAGGVLHFTGIAWAGEATVREPAFLSGACLALPRERFEAVGGFSGHYFLYHEDVDLSLRLRLAGARLGVEPAAVVDHDYEFAKGPAKWRYLERNRWATILRCYPTRLLIALVPGLLATELALLVVAAAGGWLPQKLAATGETLRALPRLARERRAVQATRTITDREFAAWLTPDLDSPFLGRAAGLGWLRRALRAYWRLVLRAVE